MTNTIYIHQPEKAFSFTRLPNFLFEAPTFQPLSNEAKVLYAFVLRRAELSRKNGWADEYGRVYLYYPICEVVALLRCGRQKAVNTLRELQYAGLVEIQKQGCGKPNRIYPRNPMKRFQTPTSRNPVMVRRRAENRTWRVRKSILLKYGNLTVYRNTEIKTIYLHSFHSNPIRDIFGGKTRRKGMEWGKEFNGTTRNFAI